VIIWSWVIGSIFNILGRSILSQNLNLLKFLLLVGLSLAEICSTYPTVGLFSYIFSLRKIIRFFSGGVYNWTGQLSPIRYAPLASYICGWFNFFGNVGGNAAYARQVGITVFKSTKIIHDAKVSRKLFSSISLSY
jgi:hypothetical protein